MSYDTKNAPWDAHSREEETCRKRLRLAYSFLCAEQRPKSMFAGKFIGAKHQRHLFSTQFPYL